MELQEAIERRRSIRKFTDYRVSDDELKEVLEAARMAPSWANTQAWEFIIVKDKDTIEKIVDTFSVTNPARKCTLAASVVIVGCAKNNIAGYKEGRPATKHREWFMFDMGLAVQNLCLKVHEIGLGTVITGFLDHERCREILSVPEGYDVVVSLPIGKPAVSPKEGPPRKELGDFVHLNRFGDKFFK